MICEYCNTEFKTTSALNIHKIKAKYCLTIQGKIKPKEEEVFKCNLCEKILSSKQRLETHKEKCNLEIIKKEIFQCEYCYKILSSKQNLENHSKKCEIIEEKQKFQCEYCDKILSTKQSILNHLDICDKKKDIKIEKKEKELKEKEKEKEKELKEKEKELKEKEKIIIKIKIQNENYEKQIKIQNENYEKQENSYKEQIKDLQDKLDKIANKAIDRPTTTNNTTNNTLNISSFMDFNDIDKAKNIIENKLDINHVIDGQKGLARFVKDTFLTDENGKLLYLCTDPSRHIFKYKDTAGEIKKDIEAKKLTDYILKGGIRTQSSVIGNEWCKDDDGDININKLNIMIENQENIMRLSDNNSNFKKELATITYN